LGRRKLSAVFIWGKNMKRGKKKKRRRDGGEVKLDLKG
jgi:hypothetical protein